MTKSMSTSSDYDSLMSPSMFSNGRLVEFSFIMNDMYLGNLFQKEAGFTSHRSKAIIAKMCKEEMHYLSVRNMDTMNSEMTVEDCFEKPDEKHTYSKDFIMAMGKRVAQKVKKSAKYEEIILDRVSRNMHDTMMMTYSLETCRVENKTIEVSTEQSTNITFLTMQKLTEEFGTSVTSQIVSKENVVEAIFSMFAKPQIGGPREILIQSYKTRLHVKFLENIMEGMCSIHEKEMLSKGAVKEDIQSSTSSEFKKTLILRAKKDKKFSIISTLIADASRWAPSFVMTMFIYFLISLELPTEIEAHMVTVLRSFSSKTVMLPKALRKKWEKKPSDQTEEDPVMEWVRRVSADSSYTMKIFSGMGQGMLHRFSSFLHCAKDDMMDELVLKYVSTMNAELEMRTMISSDDLMKQMIMSSRDPKSIFMLMKVVMIVYEVTNMLSNIHTNWKKTALSFIMDEFNSYFSRGKKATMAVIKDVFTCTEVVDLTEPLQAVKDIWSSVSRAFNHGMYLRTAGNVILCMREWVKDAYCLTNVKEEELCQKLNCLKTELPADLGFISTDHILGQLVFGPDILMYRSSNSKELTRFYKNIHTGLKEESKELVSNQTLMAISGKIRIKLPGKTDKMLKDMIDSYFMDEDINIDAVLDRENKYAFVYDESDLTWTSTMRFTNGYFIGMKKNYGFNSSMQVNSMVRALQASREKLTTRPLMEEDTCYSFDTFVDYILTRDAVASSITMYAPFKEMMVKTEEAELIFPSCSRSQSSRHTRKRKLKFRTSELVMRADKEDIIGFIVGNEDKLSNRVLTVVSDLCNMMGMDFVNFSRMPMAEIMRVFSFSDRPALIFSNMLDEYLSLRVNYSTSMMISDIDKGNALDNLLSVYCDRANAYTMMTVKKQDALVRSKNMITTWVSIGKNLNDIDLNKFPSMIDITTNTMTIETSDSPMDRAIKIWLDSMGAATLQSSKYVFHRCFERSRDKIMHFYSNLNDTVMMHIDRTKKMVVYHIMSSDPEGMKNSELIKFYTLDEIRENAESFEKFYWDGVSLTNSECIIKKKIEYSIEESTNIKDWKMNLRFKFGRTYDSNLNKCVINLFTDKYTLDMETLREMFPTGDEFMVSFMKVVSREMDVTELEAFMHTNDMFVNNTIGERDMINKVAHTQNVTPLTDDIMAIKGAWNDEDMLAYFSGISLDAIMEANTLMEENEYDWSQMEAFMDDTFLAELMMGLEAENELEPKVTKPFERMSMNTYIFDCLRNSFELEIVVNERKLTNLFKNMNTEEGSSKIWDLVTTEVLAMYPKMKSWMVRYMVALIYLKVSRVKKVPKPNKISVIRGMENRTNTIVLGADVTEELLIMARLE